MADNKYFIGDRFIFCVAGLEYSADGRVAYRMDCGRWLTEDALDASREAFPEPMDAKHHHPVIPDEVYNLCLRRIDELSQLVKRSEAERDALCDFLNGYDPIYKEEE